MSINIDIAIAEQIMGWKPMGKNAVGGFWAPELSRTQMIHASPLHEARKKIGIDHDVPGDGFCVSFTTNESDAFKIFKKLAVEGCYLGASLEIDRTGSAGCSFHAAGTGNHERVWAGTVSMAICLAALKARGLESLL